MELRVNPALGQAIAALVDRENPLSHYDLGVAFRREGLQGGDPGQKDADGPIGKRRRVSAVLNFAADTDQEAGGRLVTYLLERMRGAGCFAAGSTDRLDENLINNARSTLRSEGFLFDEDGRLAPLVLDELEGRELTSALRLYVERARSGASDAALLAGTGKDLLEATARQVLVERTGSYNEHMPFPGTGTCQVE